jgi:hypothetical protein
MLIKDLKKDLNIDMFLNRSGNFTPVLKYKDVILWATIYNNLDKMEVGLYKYEEEDFEEYSIVGKTEVYGFEGEYDFSSYGSWETLEEAEEWLENPYPLY